MTSSVTVAIFASCVVTVLLLYMPLGKAEVCDMDAVREAANMPDPVEWMEISVSNEDISELQKAAKDQAVADDGRSIDVATDPVLVEAYRQAINGTNTTDYCALYDVIENCAFDLCKAYQCIVSGHRSLNLNFSFERIACKQIGCMPNPSTGSRNSSARRCISEFVKSSFPGSTTSSSEMPVTGPVDESVKTPISPRDSAAGRPSSLVVVMTSLALLAAAICLT